MLEKYSETAGFERNISPQALRHFFLTWLKKQGVEDKEIHPYFGCNKPESLDIYKKTAMKGAQHTYNKKIKYYPIWAMKLAFVARSLVPGLVRGVGTRFGVNWGKVVARLGI